MPSTETETKTKTKTRKQRFVYTPWRRLSRPPYDRLLFLAIDILRMPRKDIARAMGVTRTQLSNYMRRGSRLPAPHTEALITLLSEQFLDYDHRVADIDPADSRAFQACYRDTMLQLCKFIHEVIKQERAYTRRSVPR